MMNEAYRVRTPLFPTYSQVRHLLRAVAGLAKATVTGMTSTIWGQTGTPQNPVDWSDPDTWIGQRLSGDEADLATRVWVDSGRTVNPRHVYGAYLLINSYRLAVPDDQGVYQLSERGRLFLEGDAKTVRELDEVEGLLELLAILSTKTRAKRGDLLPEWSEYLRAYSKFGKPSTISDTLWRRLSNLMERRLVAREGIVYTLTPQGADYAATVSPIATDPRRQVQATIRNFNDAQRDALRERLHEMPPYAFERLISELLGAMGYEDVEVTQESGDRGVDVTAKVQFGITTVKETVQVKRHRGSIGRPVLDQLRGALPYHGAIRGTLITLSTFSKRCEEAALFPGAAPITLIDGEKLLDLLIDYEIGVTKRMVPLYEIEEALFEEEAEDTPPGTPGGLDEAGAEAEATT